MYPLKKVVLRSCTERAFTIAEDGVMVRKLLPELISADSNQVEEKSIFCVQNIDCLDSDLEPSEIQYFIEDCQPFKRGSITNDTEIIVRKPKSASANSISGYSNNLPTPFLLSSFIKSSKNEQNIIIQASILLNIPDFCKDDCDENSTLFISNILAAEYALFDKSCVFIYLENNEKQDDEHSLSRDINNSKLKDSLFRENDNAKSTQSSDQCFRPVEIRILNSHVSEEFSSSFTSEHKSDKWAAIGFTLFYNLCGHERLPSSGTFPLHLKVIKKHLTSCDIASHCPLASEIYISTIISPTYNANGKFDKSLKKYFNTNRYLKSGDVIYIDIAEGNPPFTEKKSDVEEESYFLHINKIVPESDQVFCINPNDITLYQERVVHSFAPTLMFHTSDGCPFVYPPGLKDVTEQLVHLMQPLMKKTNNSDIVVHPTVLVSGPRGVGKRSIVLSASRILNVHLCEVNCYELQAETSASSEAKVEQVFQQAIACCPCVLLFRNIHALAKENDGVTEDCRVTSSFSQRINELCSLVTDWPVVVIATTSKLKNVSVGLHSLFIHNLEIETPDIQQRLKSLKQLMQAIPLASDINIKYFAQRTAGMVLADLSAFVTITCSIAVERLRKEYCSDEKFCAKEMEAIEKNIADCRPLILKEDLDLALEHLQTSQLDGFGTAKIPNVNWDDVGGLGAVKAEILDTIQLPIEHPELIAAGLRRSGILLYGPPGTGKTLLAKAVATECSLNFLSVKGPELLNMYVGQSEENVREVFAKARSAAPCVIFFDELDSLAPNRGRSGDSGGVMDRVVSQLLAELDGLHKNADVFVIGATNRPDLIDPALLRPGRFDKLVYLGIGEDRSSQLKIIKALTRKLAISPECDLENVANCCPTNMTGADFYALCSDAALNAIKRQIAIIESSQPVEDKFSKPANRTVMLIEEDFTKALETLVPSVSEQELKRYKQLQQTFIPHS